MKLRLATILAVIVTGFAVPGTALAGTTGGLTLGPDPIDFGTVHSGNHPTIWATLTNHTGTSVTIYSTSFDDGAYVSSAGNTCTNGKVLADGTFCEYGVTLDRTSAGTVTDGLDIDTDYAWMHADITATVAPPPIKITSSGVRLHSWNNWKDSLSFYPLVRDGYKDTATYGATFNQPASGVVKVIRTTTGRVVRTFGFSDRRRVSEVWNGHSNAGAKVKPGGYHFVTSVHAVGSSKTISGGAHKAAVTTAWRTERIRKHRNGSDPSGRSTASTCTNYRDTYYGTANPDCFDAGSASDTYGWSVPSGAFDVSTSIGWARAGDDVSFAGGTITVDRPTAHSIRLTVSGGHSAVIYGAHITYSVKVRI